MDVFPGGEVQANGSAPINGSSLFTNSTGNETFTPRDAPADCIDCGGSTIVVSDQSVLVRWAPHAVYPTWFQFAVSAVVIHTRD